MLPLDVNVQIEGLRALTHSTCNETLQREALNFQLSKLTLL